MEKKADWDKIDAQARQMQHELDMKVKEVNVPYVRAKHGDLAAMEY
jgi:hypothetical protein